jgi:ribosome assembly protein YihI (activator of Der GTPase)
MNPLQTLKDQQTSFMKKTPEQVESLPPKEEVLLTNEQIEHLGYSKAQIEGISNHIKRVKALQKSISSLLEKATSPREKTNYASMGASLSNYLDPFLSPDEEVKVFAINQFLAITEKAPDVSTKEIFDATNQEQATAQEELQTLFHNSATVLPVYGLASQDGSVIQGEGMKPFEKKDISSALIHSIQLLLTRLGYWFEDAHECVCDIYTGIENTYTIRKLSYTVFHLEDEQKLLFESFIPGNKGYIVDVSPEALVQCGIDTTLSMKDTITILLQLKKDDFALLPCVQPFTHFRGWEDRIIAMVNQDKSKSDSMLQPVTKPESSCNGILDDESKVIPNEELAKATGVDGIAESEDLDTRLSALLDILEAGKTPVRKIYIEGVKTSNPMYTLLRSIVDAKVHKDHPTAEKIRQKYQKMKDKKEQERNNSLNTLLEILERGEIPVQYIYQEGVKTNNPQYSLLRNIVDRDAHKDHPTAIKIRQKYQEMKDKEEQERNNSLNTLLEILETGEIPVRNIDVEGVEKLNPLYTLLRSIVEGSFHKDHPTAIKIRQKYQEIKDKEEQELTNSLNALLGILRTGKTPVRKIYIEGVKTSNPLHSLLRTIVEASLHKDNPVANQIRAEYAKMREIN